MQIPNHILEHWNLNDTYNYILDSILFNAGELELKPVYRYENESGRELPMGFETTDIANGIGIQCRHTRLGSLLENGSLEQLIDLLKQDDQGNYKITELLKEMFNGADRFQEERLKEAA